MPADLVVCSCLSASYLLLQMKFFAVSMHAVRDLQSLLFLWHPVQKRSDIKGIDGTEN